MSALRTDLALLNRGHPTRWGNLGDWSEARDYPSACAALAARLGRAAGLGPGDRVLDCGAGAGEQLALWTEAFGVDEVVALDLLPGNVDRARRRVVSGGLDDRVRVLRGSATDLGAVEGRFDAVVALDCAYHFRPRARFLAEAAARAPAGARLALTDVLLPDRRSGSVPRALSRWAGVPGANLTTRRGYLAELRAAGWEPVEVEGLDAAVLAGFADFALGPLRRRAFSSPLSGWPKALGTGLGLRLAHARGWLHYALISAVRA
jgi:microcystin synthetase protein McyJ